MSKPRVQTTSEILAKALNHVEESRMRLPINRAKVMQLYLLKQGYKLVRIETASR
jgi:hypothetical protein